jgi:heat shock protein HslJ
MRYPAIVLRVVLLVTALAVAGCDEQPTSPGPGTPAAGLTGHTWTLVNVTRNGQPVPVAGASRYTVRFAANGDLAVRSDCNSCGGTYTASGSSLRTSGLACTEAFCGDTSFDGEFTRALSQAASFDVNQNTLTIVSGATTLRFGNVILPPITQEIGGRSPR